MRERAVIRSWGEKKDQEKERAWHVQHLYNLGLGKPQDSYSVGRSLMAVLCLLRYCAQRIGSQSRGSVVEVIFHA